MKIEGNVFNIQHFSLHDGPGIRTVIFLKGCPLDCIWCHNPESKAFNPQLMYNNEKCTFCGRCVAACPQGCHIIEKGEHKINRQKCIACEGCTQSCGFEALALSGKRYTADEIMREIAKEELFFANEGGVTFSGGEPFAQAEFLLALLKRCREKGYHTCVETCGMVNKETLEKSIPLINLFLFDIKETNGELHQKFTGSDNSLIMNNLQLLEQSGARVILRCPVISGCNDRAEHFENIGRLAEKLNCVKSVELMPYHPLGIIKAEQLGQALKYNEKEFLDKEKSIYYAEIIKGFTKKSVLVSGE